MQIFQDIHSWQETRAELPSQLSLGFVATMGNLHEGHRSLCSSSLKDNDRTVVSIFVNPTQFNNPDDFTSYPRTLAADLDLLAKTGVDYCLLPNDKEIYSNHHFQILENNSSLLMEGKHRPGHFTGVLTVVMKLLNIVKPDRAYFGEKDYQQLNLIRDMVTAFFMDITIVACPTIREKSGLAYSSRNNRLSPKDRNIAEQFAQIFHQKNKSNEQLIKELQALGVTVDYLEEHGDRRLTAVNIGNIRLIDNYRLE